MQFPETLINLSTGFLKPKPTCRHVDALGSKPVDRIICPWINLSTGLLQMEKNGQPKKMSCRNRAAMTAVHDFFNNIQSRTNFAILPKRKL